MYGRVATSEQDVDVQRRARRKDAARRGWRLHGEYADEGVSGATRARPALSRLMQAACRREFDVLWIWTFDRVARSTRQLLLTVEAFRHRGIHVVSLTEQIDTASPLGEARFTIHYPACFVELDLVAEESLKCDQRGGPLATGDLDEVWADDAEDEG